MANVASGIYRIFCVTSSRFYIGSARDIKRRFTQHACMLRKGKHYNKFLQAEWDKYSCKAFRFEIVEEVQDNENQILLVEQKWLDKHYDQQNQCFNMQPNAGSCRGRKRSFEEKEKISKSKLGKPMFALSKTFNVSLLSPDGKMFGPVTNSEQFAKEHNLNPGHLWSVLNGKRLTHHGWRLSTTPPDKVLLEIRGKRISKSKTGKIRQKLEKPKLEAYIYDNESTTETTNSNAC